MNDHSSSNIRFQGGFVLLFVAAISLLFFVLIQSFVKPLLLAAIFTPMVHPVHRWFRVLFLRLGRLGKKNKASSESKPGDGKKVPFSSTLASLCTILVVIVLIFGPLTAFVGVVANQAKEITETVLPKIKKSVNPEPGEESDDSPFEAYYNKAKNWLDENAPFLAEQLPDREQILNGITSLAKTAGEFLVSSASKMTAGTASFFLSLFVMLYAMFFFLVHGKEILEKILLYIPLPHEDEERMLGQFRSITRATIKGTIVIGIIQGALGGLGFYFAGVTGFAFWGTIMVILSIIPGIGSALVWVPAVIWFAATGEMVKAIVLAVYMGALVGSLDNFLRPKLVGKDAQMPDLLILLGTLGGIFVFGVIGFIIGPVICGLFLTAWEIYGKTFQAWLPEVGRLDRKLGLAASPTVAEADTSEELRNDE